MELVIQLYLASLNTIPCRLVDECYSNICEQCYFKSGLSPEKPPQPTKFPIWAILLITIPIVCFIILAINVWIQKR
jgi:hypothetical protein